MVVDLLNFMFLFIWHVPKEPESQFPVQAIIFLFLSFHDFLDLLFLALAHVDQSWNHWFCGSFSRCFLRDDDVTSFPTKIPLFKWTTMSVSLSWQIMELCVSRCLQHANLLLLGRLISILLQ